MGDLNAVDVAQQVHLDVLTRECSGIKFLEYGLVLPDQRLLRGVYIDDTLVASVVQRRVAHQASGPDFDAFRQSRAACKETGLLVAEEKGFGFGAPCAAGQAPQAALKFVTWGTEVDSYSGQVGTPTAKR